MKRVLVGLILLGLIGGIYVATTREVARELHILSEIETSSRLLSSPQESFGFTLSFSEENPLFVEADYLLDAALEDLNTTLPLRLVQIEGPSKRFDRFDKHYASYTFEFALALDAHPGYAASFDQGVLTLTYLEDIELTIPIGSFAILVEAIQDDTPLSLVRLYGKKEEGGCGGITQLLIGIENTTAVPIEIVSITSGFASTLWLPIREASIHPNERVDELSEFGGRVEATIPIIPGYGVQYVVWKRSDDLVRLSRFYLVLEYVFLGETYRFHIDDFRYYQDSDGEECHEQRFVETRYVYPR
jgi:hypothetical protein